MNQHLTRDKISKTGFYAGLVVKTINALIEIIGGCLMILINHARLNQFIWLVALNELHEDPKDLFMNIITSAGQNLSINAQHSIAIYLLLNGITKFSVIVLLWRQKIWAYPLEVVLVGLFVIYETYSYLHSHSWFMLLLVIFDLAVIVLVLLEYKRLKKEKAKK
jgi:uncharacterized membrane protein